MSLDVLKLKDWVYSNFKLVSEEAVYQVPPPADAVKNDAVTFVEKLSVVQAFDPELDLNSQLTPFLVEGLSKNSPLPLLNEPDNG